MFYSASDLVGKRPSSAKPVRKAVPPAEARKTPPTRTAPDHARPADPAIVTVASAPLGVRYAILKRDTSKKFTEVAPDSVFHTGDLVRLSVMTNQRGYLYIIQRGSSGNWSPLFPDAKINGGKNLVEPGHTYEIPGGAGEAFEIDQQAGEEKIFLLLTRRPESDLDGTILALRQSDSPRPAEPPKAVLTAKHSIDDNLIAQIRSEVQARDLVFTKVDDAAEAEKAVYVVNKTGEGGSRVVVDLSLNHK